MGPLKHLHLLSPVVDSAQLCALVSRQAPLSFLLSLYHLCLRVQFSEELYSY